MIDPQAQANRWLRKMLEKDLLVSTMTDINLLRVLENGIRNGKPLLIEDVHESIEPALEPVLAKAIFTEGARRLIRLGDSNVRRPCQLIFVKTFLASRRVRAVLVSAQTWTGRPSDRLDRVERAAPLSDHERPRIEGRLNLISTPTSAVRSTRWPQRASARHLPVLYDASKML